MARKKTTVEQDRRGVRGFPEGLELLKDKVKEPQIYSANACGNCFSAK